MARSVLVAGEVELARVVPPLGALVVPLAELVLISGLSWLAVGWIDANGQTYVGPAEVALAHNIVVAIFLILSLWRFVVPVVRRGQDRVQVTNRRVVITAGGRAQSFPLADIRGVRRRGRRLLISAAGYDRAIATPKVGKARKVEQLISQYTADSRY